MKESYYFATVHNSRTVIHLTLGIYVLFLTLLPGDYEPLYK